jgi:hypothetical protein
MFKMGPSPPSSRKKWLSIYQKSNAIGQKEKGIGKASKRGFARSDQSDSLIAKSNTGCSGLFYTLLHKRFPLTMHMGWAYYAVWALHPTTHEPLKGTSSWTCT